MKNQTLVLIRSFTLLFFVSVAIFTSAQETKYKPFYKDNHKSAATLKTLLSQSKPDTNRVKYLLAIADNLLDRPKVLKTDMDSAEYNLNKAYQLAHLLKSDLWTHNTLLLYGQFYGKKVMPEKQSEVYEQAIAMAKKRGNKLMEADCWYFYFNNLVRADDKASKKKAIQRAIKVVLIYRESGHLPPYRLREVLMLRNIADLNLQFGNFELAEKQLLDLIAFQKTYQLTHIWFSYDLLSAVYTRKGELSKALYYALYTIKFEKKTERRNVVIFSRRVAEAYSAIGKTKESIEWYTKTYNICEDSYRLVIAGALARQLINNRQPEKALNLLKKTSRQYPDPSSSFTPWIYLAYVECYTALKEYQLAAPYAMSLLKKAKTDPTDEDLNTTIFFDLGEFYFAQKLYDKAAYYLEKAAVNKTYLSLPACIRLNEILYEIDVARNQPARAIVHLQEFHHLRDSIFTQERLNTVERLQVEFQAAQKENENEILRKKSQLQSKELEREQLIRKSTFGGIAFLSVVIILLYNRFNLKRRANNILMKQKKETGIAYAQLEVSVQQKNKLIEDKERLIKEVHHRVKNNLQLTMSLLNSQSFYLEDSSAISAIRESQHRLKSIALIHQKLYQTEEVSTVNINPYVAELVDYLRDSVGGGKRINFELDLYNLEMDIAQAIPLGLFLNEAITNIFKYAFPASTDGKVKISLAALTESSYELQIEDNGVGLPEGYDYLQSHTLGMTLMKGLSAQIDGELIVKNNNGLSISLIFQDKKQSLRTDN